MVSELFWLSVYMQHVYRFLCKKASSLRTSLTSTKTLNSWRTCILTIFVAIFTDYIITPLNTHASRRSKNPADSNWHLCCSNRNLPSSTAFVSACCLQSRCCATPGRTEPDSWCKTHMSVKRAGTFTNYNLGVSSFLGTPTPGTIILRISIR